MAPGSRLDVTRSPRRSRKMAHFVNSGIWTPRGDPLKHGCLGIWGSQVAEGHRLYSKGTGLVACPNPGGTRPKGKLGTFSNQSKVGLKQPFFSPQLLGDKGGHISSSEKRWDVPSKEHVELLVGDVAAD